MHRSFPPILSSLSIPVLILLVFVLASCGSSRSASTGGQATPDQGAAFDPALHPEFAQLTPVTTDSLAAAITDYVKSEASHHGGVFPVYDPKQKTQLALTLTDVHKDRLSRLRDGRYFACADFKGRDRHTYDIDVFMQPNENGLNATEVTVHKQDGQARYDWVEENGTWKRQEIQNR